MEVTVVGQEEIRERSTRAAAEFVAATRLRLRAELMRHGEAARNSRRFLRLAEGITPTSLRGYWPHADIDAVLRRTADSSPETDRAVAQAASEEHETSHAGNYLTAV